MRPAPFGQLRRGQRCILHQALDTVLRRQRTPNNPSIWPSPLANYIVAPSSNFSLLQVRESLHRLHTSSSSYIPRTRRKHGSHILEAFR
jgi:hypothetical protein